MIYIKVYEFKVDDYEFTMIVDEDNIRLDITSPESFPFPNNTLNFKNDNESSPIKEVIPDKKEEKIAKEVNFPPKDPNKDLWWQEYKLNHKQQYLDEITAALNKTFNSDFKITEEQ